MILVIAEAALELVPENISKHPAILSHAQRRGKDPSKMLLDRSYHHAAMKKLGSAWKRGRPDITHITLLEVLGTPLYMRGRLKVYVHTVRDEVIKLYPGVRLPRNYERFLGLFEQLLQLGEVPPGKPPLLKVEKGGLQRLVRDVKPSKVIALTTLGKPKPLKKLCEESTHISEPMFLIGGFPRGHFEEETLQTVDESYRVYKEHLETWVIASRLIYAYEMAEGLSY
ncbi:MAG: 16S rRNA methyltransferase [Thermoproteota archaeon]